MQTRYFNLLSVSLIFMSATLFFNADNANAAIFIARADVNEMVDSTETGLTNYPGSTSAVSEECTETNSSGICKKNKPDNVKIDFAIGAYGLKLVVTKRQSRDSATDIAAFYQRELARFGSVLDCSQTQPKPQFELTDDEDNTLTCDTRPSRTVRNKSSVARASQQAADSRYHFRAGTKDNQRIVAINQKDGVNEIQLIYVNARLPDWMKSNGKTNISVSP